MKQSHLHPASHCPLLVLSRADGRSSVAAAAYAARTRMVDERTGLIYNYKNVTGLIAEGLVGWSGSAEELWNSAEMAETRSNARVARELRPALPAELPLDQQRRLVHGMACWLRDRFGVASHYCIHGPKFHDTEQGKKLWRKKSSPLSDSETFDELFDPDVTNKNFHVHLRFTVRVVDRDTGAFGIKTRELDDKKWGSACVVAIREEWEKRVNAALAKVGSSARIDLRSYEDLAAAGDAPSGLKAQRHSGPKRSAIERKQMAELRRKSLDDVSDLGAAEIARIGQNFENERLWTAWEQARALDRAKAREDGTSARIAAEREAARRDELQRLSEAADIDVQREDAVEKPSSRQVSKQNGEDSDLAVAHGMGRKLDAYVVAIRDLASGRAAREFADEFDEVIDPETYELPSAEEPPRIMKPVKRTVTGPRQRVR
ncbi:MobA/MobL family protein [Primorskyibacter flagellatus]|nr:MobA/MobL family protein [Primorskyibacter flagellatus]